MGTDFNKDTGLSEMSKLPGITDLPSAVKVPFIKALKAEENGQHSEAQAFLDTAILKEEELNSQRK